MTPEVKTRPSTSFLAHYSPTHFFVVRCIPGSKRDKDKGTIVDRRPRERACDSASEIASMVARVLKVHKRFQWPLFGPLVHSGFDGSRRIMSTGKFAAPSSSGLLSNQGKILAAPAMLRRNSCDRSSMRTKSAHPGRMMVLLVTNFLVDDAQRLTPVHADFKSE